MNAIPNIKDFWDKLEQTKLSKSLELHEDTQTLMESTRDKVAHILTYFEKLISWWLMKWTRRKRSKLLNAATNQINFNTLNEQFAQWLEKWKLIHANWDEELIWATA